MARKLVPVKRLDLGPVSGRLYDALAWLAHNDILGCNAEDVAKFLLTKEIENMARTGYFEKAKAFKEWLDREMADV